MNITLLLLRKRNTLIWVGHVVATPLLLLRVIENIASHSCHGLLIIDSRIDVVLLLLLVPLTKLMWLLLWPLLGRVRRRRRKI
jgi:hypothetical protein